MSKNSIETIRKALEVSRATWEAEKTDIPMVEKQKLGRASDEKIFAAFKEAKVTVLDAYLMMFRYLDWYWNDVGQPDAIGNLLSSLSPCLDNNGVVVDQPMDAAVFPKWLECADEVLSAESVLTIQLKDIRDV